MAVVTRAEHNVRNFRPAQRLWLVAMLGHARSLGLALRAPELWLLVGLCLALLLASAQAPLSYRFQVGQETGRLSDQPFLERFNPGEGSGAARFRWSKAEATIMVPGVGRRGLLLSLPVVSHRAQWEEAAPPTLLTLRPNNSPPLAFALRREGATYRLLLPARLLDGGALRLALATEPWRGDGREELGVALGKQVGIDSLRPDGPVLPDRSLLLAWPLALMFCWLALWVLGFPRRQALALLLPLALTAPLLLLLDAPRLAWGNAWITEFALLVLGSCTLLAALLPPLLGRLGASSPPAIVRALALAMALTFALKYGGRLYPDAMPGDMQLHINRYSTTVAGGVYIMAQHRGLPFPFPPALYLLLAPFSLALPIRLLFELTAGLFEAGTVLLLFVLLRQATANATLGLLAAGTYALIAAPFMVTWFAFETQVAGQFATTLLLALLVLRWPHYDDPLTWAALLMLFVQVFLGHIGQCLNAALVGLLALPLLWRSAADEPTRRGVRALATAGLAGGAFAIAFYYSAFGDLIAEQVRGVASAGLNEVTGKAPIPRATTLRVLWEGGLLAHLGFFPAPLAAIGALLLWRGRLWRSPLPALIATTLLVSTSQGLLPLLTLSSITTRWLMFATWAVAACAALTLLLLWRRGRPARLVTLAMAGYVGWLTLLTFLDAMALRKPPIEPF